MFSKWVEVFPTRKDDTSTVVKCLMRDVIPWFDLPQSINSDRGTHFTGQIVKKMCQTLGINWQLHVPYHPQSSGQVERMNGTIKSKLGKTVDDTGLAWPDALPLVLYTIRSTPCRTTGLSPHEVLMGRIMSTGVSPPPTTSRAALVWTDEAITDYTIALAKVIRQHHLKVSISLPIPSDSPTHGFHPGDMIMLKSLNPNVLLPRWQGPTQVLLTTRTTVKLQGKPEWIHARRCRPAPPKEESTNASDGPPLPWSA